MKVIQELISTQNYFPGNPYYPLLLYKQCILDVSGAPQTIQAQLAQNNWEHSWVDSIYDYHHYHSNTHEVLAIISGECQAQFGGENGFIHTVNVGDVVIIPAGVAHKSIGKSNNFQCIGAYPFDIEYDMKYGHKEEYPKAVELIKKVVLPKKDPVFGENGLLFHYWK